uniref:Uncharacterized protein n=1 Tax=Pyxicephalus adspersus TaxID=30357 RepID=A0AAV3ATM6_PYXAD|nr:TPA: hypothetical protein GDO54_008749 [Pyxicephalus adspersus]
MSPLRRISFTFSPFSHYPSCNKKYTGTIWTSDVSIFCVIFFLVSFVLDITGQSLGTAKACKWLLSFTATAVLIHQQWKITLNHRTPQTILKYPSL